MSSSSRYHSTGFGCQTGEGLFVLQKANLLVPNVSKDLDAVFPSWCAYFYNGSHVTNVARANHVHSKNKQIK